MLFQKKQIAVLALVILIVIAGYLQYSYKKSSTASNENGSGKLGEAVYVDNNLADEAGGDNLSEKNNENKGKEEKKADVEASQETEEFFVQTKLSREASVSKNADSLRAITEDANASEEVKAQAYEKLMKLTERAEMELKIEALIAEAGFEDALVLFGEDGGMDIIVKAPTLTSKDVAKISDIASRHANVSLDKIYIKNKY